MQNNYNLIKSEFITTNYPCNLEYIHWSRIYEWKYVYDYIEKIKPKTLHNTSCGGLNVGDCLHLTFCSHLSSLCPGSIHSDKWGGGYIGTEVKPEGDDFIYYDVTQPFDRKFDVVLNISTLEHLKGNEMELALYNLVKQINKGGDLILTFDYPEVNLDMINNFFKCDIKPSPNIITNGELNVALVHIKL
jgi:hypothetical protein